jgi:hypothetical protein
MRVKAYSFFFYLRYMKKWFLLILVWIYFPTFAQEVVNVNFKDSCIIRSTKLSRKDFLNMKHLCPPELSKVSSCIISVTLKGESRDFNFNGGTWDPKMFRSITAGDKIYFTNIKGDDPNGKNAKAADITISIH